MEPLTMMDVNIQGTKGFDYRLILHHEEHEGHEEAESI
jgi:hypothetical protein